MARFTGGCFCGAVRFEAAADPLVTRICLCRDCQHLTGGAGSVLAFFATDAVKIEGRTGDYASPAASGVVMHREFCPSCGAPLFSRAEARPHLIGIRVGSLDDPSSVRPDSIIWTDSAPGWMRLDPDLPQTPRQPPPLK